ncbi:PIN domain-containing protein [Streptosporangium saharense]|uniref:Putative nucleic acid-binding protein n=1 Tax=Streptosporangium saharense TaxID=1706840 RepID=A0A7W7VKT7_9ACTN|nr:PIN domain-containing protein [Streptosporangium saharense]MBB4914041.1 putative nucleic acid-binding protein [Streptosporangium saharense]
MARVFVDTNVLFPFSLMDLMLALTEDAVHTLVWSDHLLAEWERVIVRERQRSAPAAAGISAAIREFFADSRVPDDDYKHLLAQMEGPDPDDCHHMAAAVAGRVRVLVTWNLADFPAAFLARYGVTVADPDAYLCSLLSRSPREVLGVLRRMAAGKRRPPMTTIDLVGALDRAGVTLFARSARDRLDGLSV